MLFWYSVKKKMNKRIYRKQQRIIFQKKKERRGRTSTMLYRALFLIVVLLLTTAFITPASIGSSDVVENQKVYNMSEEVERSYKKQEALDDFSRRINSYAKEEIMCLAQNIYHEARNDMLAGQFAVADVVLNRVDDRRFPNTICEVVKEGPVYESAKTKLTDDPDDAIYYPVKHKCQFSWYCDGEDDDTHEELAWRQATTIAYMILGNLTFRGITEGSTHYHATYVNPRWAKTKYPVGRIGKHKFYRWL